MINLKRLIRASLVIEDGIVIKDRFDPPDREAIPEDYKKAAVCYGSS